MLESLLHSGFIATREAARLNSLPTSERSAYLKQQYESYINHLAQDEAVSILYHYYLDQDGDVFTSSSRNPETNVKYQIDFNERNGLFYEGLLSATSLARQNPNQLVVLYSPTGKKLFQDTPLNSIDPSILSFLQKPYTEGQLYFLQFDGQKINNVAVSINGNENPWLSEISSDFNKPQNIEDEEQRIHSYLTSPIMVGNLQNFFERIWSGNHLIYTNINQEQFFLNNVLSEMKATFAGMKQLPIDISYIAYANSRLLEITEAMMRRGYEQVLLNFMDSRELSFIRLGGGCGGDLMTRDELLGEKTFSSFSSGFRFLKQGMKDLVNSAFGNDQSDEFGPLSFDCEKCGHKNTRPKHKLIQFCQNTRCRADVSC